MKQPVTWPFLWLGRLLFLFASFLNYQGAEAQIPVFDSSFAPQVDGPVSAVLVQKDGRILIGGSFSSVNGVAASNVARLNGDGSLDAAFQLIPGANGNVSALGIQSSGAILIGGSFNNVHGLARQGLARLNPDGSVDSTFISTNTPTVVSTLYVQADDRVVAAGRAYLVAGQQTNFSIARISANGLLDHGFANSANLTYVLAANDAGSLFVSTGQSTAPTFQSLNSNGTTNAVFSTRYVGAEAIGVQADGNIIIGGMFPAVNGYARPSLIRFFPSGLIDPSFDARMAPNQDVMAVLTRPGGKIIIGGRFSSVGGAPRLRLAQLNQDGSVDAAIDFGGANGVVNSLTSQPDGNLLVAGDFTRLGGQPAANIGRFVYPPPSGISAVEFSVKNYAFYENATNAWITLVRRGATNSSASIDFGASAGTAVAGSDFAPQAVTVQFGPGQAAKIVGVPLFPDALVDGDKTVNLTLTNPTNCILGGLSNGVLRILDHSPSFTFSLSQIQVSETASNLTLNVSRTAEDSGTNTVDYVIGGGTAVAGVDYTGVSGTLQFTNGISGQSIVVPILDDASYELDKVFSVSLRSPTGGAVLGERTNVDVTLPDNDEAGTPGRGFNGSVWNISRQFDGKFIVAGAFTSAFGQAGGRVIRLNADFTVDPSFSVGLGADREVYISRPQSDGKILLAGWFTTFNGATANRIVRLNSDGSIDPTFNAGLGADQFIESVATQPDGKIVVVGGFSRFAGAARKGIARLNADGSLDTSFVPPLMSSFFFGHAVALLSDGRMIIAASPSGASASASNDCVFRLNTDGSRDGTFVVRFGKPWGVTDLLVGSDDKILVGGNFLTVNDMKRSRLARLNPDGSLDETFSVNPKPDELVFRLMGQGDGKIIAVGAFLGMGGGFAQGICGLNTDGTIDTSFFSALRGGANDYVRTALPLADGRILVGGDFTGFSGYDRFHFATLLPTGALEGFEPKFSAFSPLLNGGLVSTVHVEADRIFTVESSTNLVNWFPISTNLTGRTSMDLSWPGLGAPHEFFRLRQSP